MVEKALKVHTGAYWKRVGVRIPVGKWRHRWLLLSALLHMWPSEPLRLGRCHRCHRLSTATQLPAHVQACCCG